MPAPSRTGSETFNDSSSAVTSHSYSHTTTSDTSLLLLVIHIEGNESISGTPTFDSANFTLITSQSATGSNGDTRSFIYGMVSPGAKTATISISFASNVNPSTSICINYKDTETSTVAAATNPIDDVQNTSTASTAVFSSGGASGNALFVATVGQGADMQPLSFDNSFAEIWDRQTGTSNAADFGHGGAELLTGLPSGVTCTFGATDENGGILIELLVPDISPTITDVESDEDYDDEDTAITVTGTNFGATKGTGKLEVGDDPDYATAVKIEQTTTSWADTAIDFTADLGAQSPGGKWVFVTRDSGEKNDPGFAVTVHRAQAFKMSASANITASGEATTAQFTAPSGKTTGDFDAGRIQDDENPADAIDITPDDYSEFEWCILAKTAANLVQYDFRITKAGTVLTTYTVTPKLTIIVAGGPAAALRTLALTGVGL